MSGRLTTVGRDNLSDITPRCLGNAYHGAVTSTRGQRHRRPGKFRRHVAPFLSSYLVAAAVIIGLAAGAGRLLLSRPVAAPGASQPTASTPAPGSQTPSLTPTPTLTRTPTPTPSTTPSPEPPITFAVIGDFGFGDSNEAAVAQLVSSWKPSFIVGLGDVYYSEAGGRGSDRYDNAVGRFYCNWLKDVTTTGTACPHGAAAKNSFFTALGNHDISDADPAPQTYTDYFTLPGTDYPNSSGNERYYDVVQGPVHLFVLNSNQDEPDGTTADSVQGRWLRMQLAASTSRWNVVVDHHPPYSSDSSHGSTSWMQWPFAEWGADAVLSGHAHTYERIQRDGIVYFVNGLGGAERYDFGAPVEGSQVRFRSNWGAQVVLATQSELRFDFYDVSGTQVDSYTVRKR